MTLTTHAVVGTAAASIFYTNPLAAFVAAFTSHFLADAIPHWHYPIYSVKADENNPLETDMILGKQFVFDFLKIALDGCIGLGLSYVIFHAGFHVSLLITFIGAIGGMLPDALQFVYWKWRHEPLISLQRFHMWIHAKTDLDHMHARGVSLQIALILVASLFAYSYLFINTHMFPKEYPVVTRASR